MEDVDLGFRLQLRGMRCVQVRRAEVLHVGSAMTTEFFLFHSQRNRIWVMVKDIPSPLLALVLLLQVAVTPFVVLRRGRSGWRVALRGVVAGFNGLPEVWRKRRDVQSRRCVRSARIAKILVWDPGKALRRDAIFID